MKYLTPKEVAEHYRVSQDTVRRWIKAGRVPHVNLGTADRPLYRIPEDAIASLARVHMRPLPEPAREWV